MLKTAAWSHIKQIRFCSCITSKRYTHNAQTGKQYTCWKYYLRKLLNSKITGWKEIDWSIRFDSDHNFRVKLSLSITYNRYWIFTPCIMPLRAFVGRFQRCNANVHDMYIKSMKFWSTREMIYFTIFNGISEVEKIVTLDSVQREISDLDGR